jgi:hypothetical protein
MTFYPNLNWDVRYPPNWSDIRRATHEATGGICCLCRQNLSTEVHHSRYLWKGDTPGGNIYPLCQLCHKLSHSERHWVKHKGNPLWKSRNTEQWEAKLRAGFNALQRRPL